MLCYHEDHKVEDMGDKDNPLYATTVGWTAIYVRGCVTTRNPSGNSKDPLYIRVFVNFWMIPIMNYYRGS